MKRFITMIVAACALFAAMAQHPMVTLSHDGELSFFTNLTAFKSALDSAKNGDTIYLSEGEFIVSGGALTIKKRVSIVGNGYGSHILGDITIDMSSNPNSAMDAPLFDGVRLDKLIFSEGSNSYSNLRESEIRRCWIRTLKNGGWAGTHITYDKCFIENASFCNVYNGSYLSSTIFVKNSKMKMDSSSTGYLHRITAQNCNISFESGGCLPLTAISCILRCTGNVKPVVKDSSASVINSLLNFSTSVTNAYFHNCYVYNEDAEGASTILDAELNCPLNLTELNYLGQDGTEVGIYGGEYPFSENPSMPSVDTANSSVEYDAENNKLKVSITVKAD